MSQCKNCHGTGHDYSQRDQSSHGCAAHLNSSVCWSCNGTGVLAPVIVPFTGQDANTMTEAEVADWLAEHSMWAD